MFGPEKNSVVKPEQKNEPASLVGTEHKNFLSQRPNYPKALAFLAAVSIFPSYSPPLEKPGEETILAIETVTAIPLHDVATRNKFEIDIVYTTENPQQAETIIHIGQRHKDFSRSEAMTQKEAQEDKAETLVTQEKIKNLLVDLNQNYKIRQVFTEGLPETFNSEKVSQDCKTTESFSAEEARKVIRSITDDKYLSQSVQPLMVKYAATRRLSELLKNSESDLKNAEDELTYVCGAAIKMQCDGQINVYPAETTDGIKATATIVNLIKPENVETYINQPLAESLQALQPLSKLQGNEELKMLLDKISGERSITDPSFRDALIRLASLTTVPEKIRKNLEGAESYTARFNHLAYSYREAEVLKNIAASKIQNPNGVRVLVYGSGHTFNGINNWNTYHQQKYNYIRLTPKSD